MLFEDRTANEFAVSDFIPDLKMRGFHPPACPSRECKTEIINSDIILETVFGRHYRKIYEKMVGRQADIWYVSPFPPSKKTLKILNDVNHELERKDRIHTYNSLVSSVLKKLEIWSKQTGRRAEFLHAKREIEKKCKLLLNF